MPLCLDSSIIVDITRNIEPVRSRFYAERLAGTHLTVNTIIVFEMMFGAYGLPETARRRRTVDDFLNNHVSIVPFEAQDADAAAQLQVQLAVRRTALGSNDALIAGQALNRGWTLVTSDGGFDRVPGLQLQNWRESA